MRVAPYCLMCKHYDSKSDEPICAAFPDGIPREIFYEGATHFESYPGDRGIRFAPRDEREWREFVEWFGEPESRGAIPRDPDLLEARDGKP